MANRDGDRERSVDLVEWVDLSSSPLSSVPQSDSDFTYSPLRASHLDTCRSRRRTRGGSSPTPSAAAKSTIIVATEAAAPVFLVSSPARVPDSQDQPEIQPDSQAAPPSSGASAGLPERPRRRGRPTAKARATAAAVVKRPKKTIKTKKNQSPRKPKWDAERILTDPKSPLAKANLRTILSHPIAWSVLDAQEKAEILSLFPDKEHILDPDTDDARPDLRSLLNDDSFRYDCAAYTTNLALGRHDPEWLASAWGAHERRRIGDFDEFLIRKLRDDWGVELPDEMKLFRTPAGSAVPDEGGDVPVTNGTCCVGPGDAGEMRMDVDIPEDKVSS